MDVLHSVEARSCNNCSSGRAKSITCSDGYQACSCTCAVLSSVACPSLQCFSTLPRKRLDFRKEYKVCVPICIHLMVVCVTVHHI